MSQNIFEFDSDSLGYCTILKKSFDFAVHNRQTSFRAGFSNEKSLRLAVMNLNPKFFVLKLRQVEDAER